MGVKTIRITDEMFLLNRKYYLPIIDALTKLNTSDDLKLWAYSRIDTVPAPEILQARRRHPLLCLGIESGDHAIRLEVAKGKFEEVDVEKSSNRLRMQALTSWQIISMVYLETRLKRSKKPMP